ncbi:hypothetical protein [Agarivorans sp. QJM3NY_33]|uniref:hypothetical protein n=1 Tax=Agarivorans sp. QJM3NY_33 TaxID=3421432 RepID=UPI003D7D2AA2
MEGFWRWLLIIIVVMLLVRCETHASLYQAESNGIRLEIPRFLATPFVWVDKQVGQPMVWGYHLPWDDDYQFKLYSSESE